MRICIGQENILFDINPAKLQVFPYPLHLFQHIPFRASQSRGKEIIIHQFQCGFQLGQQFGDEAALDESLFHAQGADAVWLLQHGHVLKAEVEVIGAKTLFGKGLPFQKHHHKAAFGDALGAHDGINQFLLLAIKPFILRQSEMRENPSGVATRAAFVVHHHAVQFLLTGIVFLALRIDTNRFYVVHVDALREHRM